MSTDIIHYYNNITIKVNIICEYFLTPVKLNEGFDNV